VVASKVEVVMSIPRRDVNRLRAFLGLSNNYRKLVKTLVLLQSH
jgi:hypothetical protein